jgi:EmrB/QacA subfamily drug resistance transporter
MAFIDGTVVNVALPALQRDLHAGAFDGQWVVESYALFLASLLLVGGALGDRFGRRRVFAIGTALFTMASAACAMANSIQLLILARSLQGIGAALMVPGSLALLSANFAQSERGRAIGTWSAFSGIAAAVGPVLGGYLIDHYSWIWAFVINLPVGAVVLLICATRVPESRASGAPRSVDLLGALIATGGLAGVVYAFIEAPVHGWRALPVLLASIAGAAALTLFIAVEATRRQPMLQLALFRNRDFAGANLLTLLLYASLGGGLFFFPLNVIQVQGYSATAAGAAMLPFVAIMFSLSRSAGHLVDRYGPRLPLVVGPVVAAVGFTLFAVPGVGGSYWSTYFPAVCVLGLGMTITVAPLTTTVMNAVGPDRAGLASGVNNAVSRTAAVLAIAVFGLVQALVFGESLQDRLQAIALTPEVSASIMRQATTLAGLIIPSDLGAETASAVKGAVGASFVAGFRAVMLLSAALAVLSAASAWVMIGRSPPERGSAAQ